MRLLGFATFMFVACLLNAQNVPATGQNSPSKTPSPQEEGDKALLACGQMVSDELKVLKYPCKAPKNKSHRDMKRLVFARHARQCRLMARH